MIFNFMKSHSSDDRSEKIFLFITLVVCALVVLLLSFSLISENHFIDKTLTHLLFKSNRKEIILDTLLHYLLPSPFFFFCAFKQKHGPKKSQVYL